VIVTQWPVFESLAADEVARILRAGRRRKFARGETLFHHGDPADALHLLDVGYVAIRVLTPQGDQAILSVLGPGSAFGELSLIGDNTERTATATAIGACETIALHRAQFDQLRASNPTIDRFLLASLSAQVARLSDHLLEMLFSPTKLRVMRRVLLLAETFGGVIPLTQEDIALMSGTTRPTVNETLREFERNGAIRIGRGRIEVIDREQLARRLAHSG
jgi:CRP/FNR family cyclic AMP-dependent transcriptional regulator